MTRKRAMADTVRPWLWGEVSVWRELGIVSADQSARILDLYESPTEVAERKRSVAVFALMGLAGLMVGVATLLLVGYNWQAMPDAVKLALLFGAILGAHGAGFGLRYHYNARTYSELGFFLGCLFYGVAIWQVAQIFHIQSHYPNGVWVWAVGTLIFALILDTPLLHVLFVALMAIWAGIEILGFQDLGIWLFGRWRAVPNGGYSLPFLVLPGLVWAYRKGSAKTAALYAPLLAWWVVLQPFAWRWGDGEGMVYLIGAAGGLFLLVAELHRADSRFGLVYRLYGVLLAAGALVPLSFYGFNEEMFRGGYGHRASLWAYGPLQGMIAGLTILILSIAVIALAAWLKRTYGREHTPVPDQMMAILRRQWVPVGIVLLMAVLPMATALLADVAVDHRSLLPTVAANVAMIVLSIWLMQVGLREELGTVFAAGVIYFLLWTVLRYIDLFADFGGMLGAAAMFLLCGAGLFSMAMVWKRRREKRHD